MLAILYALGRFVADLFKSRCRLEAQLEAQLGKSAQVQSQVCLSRPRLYIEVGLIGAL